MTCDWHVHIAFAFSKGPSMMHFHKSAFNGSTFALVFGNM